MADQFSTTHQELRTQSKLDVPDEYFAELEDKGVAPDARGDCTREWGNSCVRPDGSVGQMVTMTCTFTNPDGSTWTQTRTWCSSGSG